MISKEAIASEYRTIQDEICRGLESADGRGKFEEEIWTRDEGGGGRTRILQEGSVIERGGVNFSEVYGKLPEAIKKSFNTEQDEFFATGVSIVIHPHHPMIPIIHMNIRYFEMQGDIRWFGGGIDLTPHYVFEDDAHYFHSCLRSTCDKFNRDFYDRFKKWADDYFFIKHRQETRGIGGIFFDRLDPEQSGISWELLFDFSKALGRSFVPIYTELISRNKNKAFTDVNKKWQYQRRSRYAEFNLVYDAGTKFGLETGGRIESILMSLPPRADWVYNYQPEKGSEEEKTLSILKRGINWAD
jgi:coproporphyrinogen III oxidase